MRRIKPKKSKTQWWSVFAILVLFMAGACGSGWCANLPSGFVEKTFNEKKPNYNIEIKYPVFANANNAGQKAFNSLVVRSVEKEIKDFRKELKDYNKQTPNWQLSFGYKFIYTSKTLLSLELNGYTYQGGAHGGPLYRTIVFDLVNAREITLKDLFKPNSPYLQRISRICIADLNKRKLLANDFINEGAGPKASNFKYFYITEKGITIIFPSTQPPAYANGEQIVVIPYKSLTDILAPNGPAKRWLK